MISLRRATPAQKWPTLVAFLPMGGRDADDGINNKVDEAQEAAI
jgi:hypothetical protein